MTAYTLISSDSHIIEPADLWEQRIDRRFKDRGPRLIHEGEFDQWYADGVKFGNIGTNQQAGLRFEAPENLTAGGSMATIPLGGVDPHAHVQDMDVDSVAGGVLYPSQGLTLYRVPDSQLLSAILRAYNDWLADFCTPYPQRLKGIAMLNLDDVTDAFRMLDEYNIEWAILRPTEALSRALSTSSAWEKVYSDDHSVVFVRLKKLIESRSSAPISSS